MDELRRAVRVAGDLTADYLSAVGERTVWQPVAEPDRSWLLGQDLPTAGRPFADLVDDLRTRVLPYPMGNGHPRFFGWVNSAPSAAGVLVAPIAAAMNPSCAGGEHAGVLLEHTVLRWLAELVGFPHSPGGGLLTSGASMATVIALAAARQRAGRQDGLDLRETGLSGHPPMVLYVSAEGHSCLRKAAELLGLGNRQVRPVPVDDEFRMDVDALRQLVVRDEQAGLRPFCVAANAGTVNTGAVDPFDEIADVDAEHGMWFHIDGAYGALGVLVDDLEARYAGLARADSLALDPHKWLGVPVDCGGVLWRDPAWARAAFSLVPAYLRDESEGGLGWFAEYGPEQTRPFRALRAWATMSHLGRDGIVRLVDTTVRLARALAAMIDAAPDFELLAPVSTSIVAFRYRPAGYDRRLDELNRQVPAAVQHRGQAFLTGTRLADTEALRACLLNPATTSDDLALLLDEIRAAAATIHPAEIHP
ncbi:pyridoxal-dependent decarboxylase [Actinoplanes sp. KI2]|uniref:pyridoxal phosphate-dependent decarboxylase family protein n=1 Tax=Actinoplanes sp. KI2 TaxID=2983315 RepID=UPI0021D5C503|nr:pyridoxal-dependent decarboxylase [Actinoplanes sp. KI2]MCU7730600.1 pyridoxal-dependent decarboxylase [Actinoplanes sp. KI2]